VNDGLDYTKEFPEIALKYVDKIVTTYMGKYVGVISPRVTKHPKNTKYSINTLVKSINTLLTSISEQDEIKLDVKKVMSTLQDQVRDSLDTINIYNS
jgi:hypothetical protein